MFLDPGPELTFQGLHVVASDIRYLGYHIFVNSCVGKAEEQAGCTPRVPCRSCSSPQVASSSRGWLRADLEYWSTVNLCLKHAA